MKTIGELWLENGKKKGLRVRWNDWGHKHHYFVIDAETPTYFEGRLECGEKAKYKKDSPHWKLYEHGDEECAKAV